MYADPIAQNGDSVSNTAAALSAMWWMNQPFVVPIWYQIFTFKFLGLLSAMGSAYIIYQMVIDVRSAEHRRKKFDRTFDRLLLGLCVSDFVASVALFFGSWYVGISFYYLFCPPRAIFLIYFCTYYCYSTLFS